MGPNQHGDCWIRKEVTAADFEAHHWEGRLLVVNATVVTSAMDGNGTLTEDPVTASAAFDLPYNADIQHQATASLVELPNGGKSCFSVSFCTWQIFLQRPCVFELTMKANICDGSMPGNICMCRVMFFLSLHTQARQLHTTSSAKIRVQAHCGMFSWSPACQTSTAPLGHSCPLGRWEPTSHALACTTLRAALWASIHTQTAFWLVTTKASHAAGQSGRWACHTHPSHTQVFISRYAWIAAIKPLQLQRRVSSTNVALRSAALYYFFVRVQHMRQLVLSALTVSLHVLAAADCTDSNYC